MSARHLIGPVLLASFAAPFAAPLVADADVVAYYRFEDYALGTGPTAFLGGTPYDPVLDASGNGNDMRTFTTVNGDTAPVAVAAPLPVVPRTGAANNIAFDFDGGVGDAGDDLYVGQPATGLSLNAGLDDGTAFTIETYVRADDTNRWATFIGRDNFGDEAGEQAQGLAYFQRNNDGGPLQNHFKFQAEDKAGNTAAVFSLAPMLANQWYHVAVVGDGTDLSLYVDGVFQNSVAFSGLFDSAQAAGWTIGRGFFDVPPNGPDGGDGPNDWWDGQIDEVRFSNAALSPTEFLNAPIPEPASLALLAAGGLLVATRRRGA